MWTSAPTSGQRQTSRADWWGEIFTLHHCHKHCLTVTLFFWHTIKLPNCHTSRLSWCNNVALSHCYTFTLSNWKIILYVTLSHCHSINVLPHRLAVCGKQIEMLTLTKFLLSCHTHSHSISHSHMVTLSHFNMYTLVHCKTTILHFLPI